jgi:GTP cyclohydrolase I
MSTLSSTSRYHSALDTAPVKMESRSEARMQSERDSIMIADERKSKKHLVSSVPNTSTQSSTNGQDRPSHSRPSATDNSFFVDPNEARNDEVDLPRIEAAVRSILEAVGEDPDREGLLETPARVARMYAEMFAGLKSDPARHLAKVFTEDYDEIVLVRDISFCSMCEHHLLPFSGKAHIAYLPSGKVVGLSKLARVVEEVARRPQVQERLTHTVADLVENRLSARGVAVVVESTHSCMTMRGVRKPGSLCLTSAMRGIFRDDPKSRSEVLGLINRQS